MAYRIMDSENSFFDFDSAVRSLSDALRKSHAIVRGGDFEQWLLQLPASVNHGVPSEAVSYVEFKIDAATEFNNFYLSALNAAGLGYLALRASEKAENRVEQVVEASKMARNLGRLDSYQHYLNLIDKAAKRQSDGYAAVEAQTLLRHEFREATLSRLEKLVTEEQLKRKSRHTRIPRKSNAALADLLAIDPEFCKIVHPSYTDRAKVLGITICAIDSMAKALNDWQNKAASVKLQLKKLQDRLTSK